MDEICSDKGLKVCWVWYAGEVSGRGGLVWSSERVGVGQGVERNQENKTRLYVSIIGDSTTANCSLFSHGKNPRQFEGK